MTVPPLRRERHEIDGSPASRGLPGEVEPNIAPAMAAVAASRVRCARGERLGPLLGGRAATATRGRGRRP